jgi:Protein of unknown function (DUF1045)
MDFDSPYRVAIYATPAINTEWWDRGSQWLGRCAAQKCSVPMPAITGLATAQQMMVTAEPRRYGWHATLKAPMRLANPANVSALRDSVALICKDHRSIELLDLTVARMGAFLALRPLNPPNALSALANDFVQRLQPLAAALSEDEIARRRRTTLTPHEDALMLAWGYPWVLDRFRFHYSLTGSLLDLEEEMVQHLLGAATAHFAGLPPYQLDCISIFIEPTAGADFVLLDQMRLAL